MADVNAIYAELAAALGEITGLQVFDYPASTVQPPSGALSYPEEIQYHLQYGDTSIRIAELPIMLVAGKADEQTARITVSGWVSTTGPDSVINALETYTGFDTIDDITIATCNFLVVQIGGIDYVAAEFSAGILAS